MRRQGVTEALVPARELEVGSRQGGRSGIRAAHMLYLWGWVGVGCDWNISLPPPHPVSLVRRAFATIHSCCAPPLLRMQNAQVMCEYSKEEFTSGLVKLGVDSVDKLKRKLPELRAELKHDDKFREVYSFAYNFSREVRAGVEFSWLPRALQKALRRELWLAVRGATACCPAVRAVRHDTTDRLLFCCYPP